MQHACAHGASLQVCLAPARCRPAPAAPAHPAPVSMAATAPACKWTTKPPSPATARTRGEVNQDHILWLLLLWEFAITYYRNVMIVWCVGIISTLSVGYMAFKWQMIVGYGRLQCIGLKHLRRNINMQRPLFSFLRI